MLLSTKSSCSAFGKAANSSIVSSAHLVAGAQTTPEENKSDTAWRVLPAGVFAARWTNPLSIPVCQFGSSVGSKFLESQKIDDVVGAIPVHMFAGIFGTLVVPMSNPDTNFGSQLLGVIPVCVFSFVLSYIVFKALKETIGLRISKEAEKLGTDKAEVGVVAYSIRD